MNTTFYLFRHGLATKSLSGYGEYVVSAQLLPEGREAIEKLGSSLKNKPVDLFISSEFPRCVQTSQIVNRETKKDFTTDKRVNEYYEISFEKFIEQLQALLKNIEKKKYKNVWICTHVAVIIAIKKILAGEDISEKELFSNFPLPGVLTILSDTGTQEINFNK